MNLAEYLAAAAATAGDRVALSCGEATLTYSQFDALVTRVAHGFLAAGVGKGDRVALHRGNTPEMAVCYFACFRLGAIAVPINVRLKPAEIDHIIAHSEARLYVGEPDLYEPAIASAAFLDLQRAPEQPLPEVCGSDPAVILYTSGTTALPKGVTHSHDSTALAAAAMIDVGYVAGDVLLGFTPLAHASGLMLVLVPAVLLATECALVSRFEARAVLHTLQRRKCTATFGLPVSLQALCREQAANPVDARSLRRCVAGGDSVSLSLQREFLEGFGVVLQEGIGMTECVPFTVNHRGRVREGSVGEPVRDVQVRIVDEAGEDLPDGAVGELVCRAPHLMLGYWKDEAATAATVRDGWLHSGDLASRDADGWVWFCGRKKEIIIRGGSNVSPQEVEEALTQHPAVYQAGVVGVPDPQFGEAVVAFVSLRESRNCGERELIDLARALLSDHKVPCQVRFVEQLPLGPTGKVSRRSLRQWVEAGEADAQRPR